MDLIEKYIGFGLEYLSEEAIFEHIDKIMYNMDSGLDIEDGLFLIEILYEEIEIRRKEYGDKFSYDSNDIFLNEMKRKSKFKTRRENKLKEFKRNEEIYKSSYCKVGFKFNQQELDKINKEKDNGNYDYFNEFLNYTESTGRYVRYYVSDAKKYLKRESNKKIRRNMYGVPLKGSKYKRYLDIDWILY